MTEDAVPRLRAGPWLACCVGFASGTALQLQQAALWPAWPYAALGLLGLALAWRGWRGTVHWRVAAVLGMVALAFGTVGLRALLFASQALSPALEGRDLLLTGRVAAMPQPGELALRLQLDVHSAHLDGTAQRMPRRVEVSWYHRAADGTTQPQPDVRAGDLWAMQVRLRAPHGHRNPHGFDYELWQWGRGVQATGYVRTGAKNMAPRLLARGWLHPVERVRQAVRSGIFARVDDPGRAGVVAGLAIGDQTAVERADWDLFRATGVSHLLSVSGLHVTMFAWLATALVGWSWRRLDRLGWAACLWCPAPHAALVGGVVLAGAYAVFSGWGVPAQRTLLMLAVVALLRLAGRHWAWPQVLALAGVAVLLLDPWALLQAGFWLSFVAVGVLFASDVGGLARGAAPRLARLLREQAVVTVALAPLSLMLFQQVSLVGLVANLLAIPWVTLVLTPLALLGVVFAPLWDLAAWSAGVLMAVLAWLALWPLASLSHPAVPSLLGAAAMLGAVLLVVRVPLGARLLGVPLLLPALLWQPVRPAPGQFDLLAADIGQGNAVLVRTARHSLLYDTGPRFGQDSDAGARVLVPLLRARGERLDKVVVSHADSDHSGGAASVLATHPQAALLASLPDGHALTALHGATPCAAGQRWEWDGVRFEILHPPPDAARDVRPNTVSCVLRVATANRAALLAGDIEQAQELQLVAGRAMLRADLLLVPHHGSKTSSSPALLRAVAPRFALVQAGYRNRFGHPAPEVVQRLQAHGAIVVATPACGAAQWRSDVPDRVVCSRAQQPRYWHHRVP